MSTVKITPLVENIRSHISASPLQAISFHDYMKLCLYHPEYGYYSQSRQKIGRAGDFYTSSSIGTAMGEMIATFIMRHQGSNMNKPWSIVEWGGGNGRLALQILQEIRKESPVAFDRLRYFIIEQSAYHRQLQLETLADFTHKACFISEADWLKEKHENVVVLSNELMDAFPVHLLQYENGSWLEIHVAWNEQEQRFQEKLFLLDNQEIERYLTKYVAVEQVELRHGQRIEINLDALEWINRVAAALAEGMVITVDYGESASQLYAPWRLRGTLMCYWQHHAHDNPYVKPGEQDMTAHVNFSALVGAGQDAGLEMNIYQTQKQFLVEAGILEKLMNHQTTDPFSAEARHNRSIRQLLLSDGMSELFKVLVQRKKTM